MEDFSSRRSPAPSGPETIWRGVFFVLSAGMAALGLVDFDNGRFAHGLGDLGLSSLMLSLLTQFPFLRAFVRASERPDGREILLKEAERLRKSQPWAARASSAGWTMMFLSLGLRLAGVE
jgi:hypothetical protein